MLSRFAITTGTSVPITKFSTALIALAVYAWKVKNIGDKSSISHPWIQTIITSTRGKNSKRTCKCGAYWQTSGQQWKRGSNTSLKTPRIQQPTNILPHNSQPHPKPSPHRLPRTKLNQVDECLQGPPVTQVATICHFTCPLEKIELMSSRMGSKILPSTVGRTIPSRYGNHAFHADANIQVKR
jgi:hypothetical protein